MISEPPASSSTSCLQVPGTGRHRKLHQASVGERKVSKSLTRLGDRPKITLLTFSKREQI
uniref:Uncharacterized protein n=1 Tax=Anguilla anguilla TaxID=7936 RepID=A0A0E9VJC2_ANGAN